MTVQELIDELQKVEDKSLPVWIDESLEDAPTKISILDSCAKRNYPKRVMIS